MLEIIARIKNMGNKKEGVVNTLHILNTGFNY